VPSPILSVKKDACADGLDERGLHSGPVGGARDLWGLILRGKCSPVTAGRRQKRNRLTAGKVFDVVVRSPSSFTISHNAERTPVACSRPPWEKLSIFSLTLARMVSVIKPSIQSQASWLMHRFLISSYLHYSVSEIQTSNTLHSPRCEPAESHFNDVALSKFTVYVVQSEGLQCGDVVL